MERNSLKTRRKPCTALTILTRCLSPPGGGSSSNRSILTRKIIKFKRTQAIWRRQSNRTSSRSFESGTRLQDCIYFIQGETRYFAWFGRAITRKGAWLGFLNLNQKMRHSRHSYVIRVTEVPCRTSSLSGCYQEYWMLDKGVHYRRSCSLYS